MPIKHLANNLTFNTKGTVAIVIVTIQEEAIFVTHHQSNMSYRRKLWFGACTGMAFSDLWPICSLTTNLGSVNAVGFKCLKSNSYPGRYLCDT